MKAPGLLLALLAGCGPTLPRAAPPPVLQPGFAGLIGIARADISAPVGIYARNWGAARNEVATGIHRPLTATVLSIQARKDDPPFLLAALDLGWWRTREDEEFVRLPLVRELARDEARVIVNLSHTHAGPSSCREDRDRPGGHLIEAYLTRVRDSLLEAARSAVASAVPAALEWRYGRCDLAVNRDLPDPDRARIVTGMNPGAPADDTLLVGRVTDEPGRILATLVNYACHPTSLAWENTLLSPDYVGRLREVVESGTGGAPCLFLQGNSGELAPRDNYSADPEVADRNGAVLGFSALSSLAAMLPPRTRLGYGGVVESGAPLAIWKSSRAPLPTSLVAREIQVEFELKSMPSTAQIARRMEAAGDPVQKERLLRELRIRQRVGDGSTVQVPLWVWLVGDAFVVAQPNEAYSDLQRTLRRLSGGRPVASLNLCNGSIGYLAPSGLHGLDLYQVWQSPFAQGSLERLIDRAAGALSELGR